MKMGGAQKENVLGIPQSKKDDQKKGGVWSRRGQDEEKGKKML